MADNPCVVFGDVHGDSKKLRKLIEIIRERYGTDVDIVSVGDLIDRGPDSKGVIDICIREGVIACMGNHDEWIVNLLTTGHVKDVWSPIWGAWATVKSYGSRNRDPDRVYYSMRARIPPDHQEYFKSMQLILRVDVNGERFWVSHSGISQSAALSVRVEGMVESDEDIISELARYAPEQIYFGYPNLKRGELYEFETGVQVFGHQVLRAYAGGQVDCH